MQALWMVLGAFFFASMAVCVKIASAWFNSSELVLYRGLIGALMLWLLARHQGISLRTKYPGMHAWRSLVGVTSLSAWFFAIAGLPVATAITLNYMSSVWLAAFLLGGIVMTWNPSQGAARLARQGPLTLTVLTGFVGVMLVMRPAVDRDQTLAALTGLLSGFAAAFAYMQVSALSKLGEPEIRIVFFFALASALAGAVGVAVTGPTGWDGWHALWVVPVGVLATLGQLCMTRAYGKGGTLVVASLQYSGIVFGALYGVLLFGDSIALTAWIGMGLIIGSGVVATVLRTQADPSGPAEEH